MKAIWGIMLSAVVSVPSMAQTMEQLRYQQAYDALRSNDQARFSTLRDELNQYPLAPYLDYYQLALRPSLAELSQVSRFIREHSDMPHANRLERSYLTYLAQTKQWSSFLSFYPSKPNSVDLQCFHYQALYETGRRNEAFAGAEQLWLTGRSRPSACDPLFTLWQQAGYLSPALIWQRMLLSFEANNRDLTRHLSSSLSLSQSRYGQQMLTLYDQPSKVLEPNFIDQTELGKSLMPLALVRYAKLNPLAVLSNLDPLTSQYSLSAAARTNVETAIAKQLLQDRTLAQQAWLNETVKRLNDKTLIELRVRLALWEQDWPGVIQWISRLPVAQQQEERWRYWQARALERTGQQQLANAIYQETAHLRGFYGFMAAQRIQAPYPLTHQPVQAVPAWQNAIVQWPFLLRVQELIDIGQAQSARAEWLHNMARVSTDQQIALGHLALNRGWHEFAVLSSIQAKAWDALDLRFPLPLKLTFLQMAQERMMNTSLLYAISRQESALNSFAQSPVGARGLMQLMPATAQETANKLGVAYQNTQQLFDPDMNIRLGSAYLKRLLDLYDGNRVLASAAYNAGPGRVRSWRTRENSKPMDIWIESIPYQETRSYVQNVLSFDLIYQHKLAQPLRFVSDLELNYVY